MTDGDRLKRIAEIIESVDVRCMAADGPVTPTRQEMTNGELQEIYRLATGGGDLTGVFTIEPWMQGGQCRAGGRWCPREARWKASYPGGPWKPLRVERKRISSLRCDVHAADFATKHNLTLDPAHRMAGAPR